MKNIKIDYWDGRGHEPMEYSADASFYPHSSFGYCYRGSIYNDEGKCIGDYAANDSCWIEKNFKINWD